jgi:pimeloyl-ACP methyl ester carboxylesterase
MTDEVGVIRSTHSADNRQITWLEYGDPDGVPMVSLHGTPGGKFTFRHVDPLLQQLGIRMLTPDRPGYGGSDPAPGRTIASYASDVVAVLDAAQIERAVVFGGSGGGPHALGVGAMAPDRVRTVGVFVGAVPLEPADLAGQVAFNQKVFETVHDEAALREHLISGRETILTDGIETLLADASEADRATLAEHRDRFMAVMADALAPGVDGMVDDFQAIWHRPWGFEPADVRRPVRWAHGVDDHNVPITAARRYADGLPECEFEEWDGGHLAGPEKMIAFYQNLIAPD